MNKELEDKQSCKTNTLTLSAYFCHGTTTCMVANQASVSQCVRVEEGGVLSGTDQNLLGIADSPR